MEKQLPAVSHAMKNSLTILTCQRKGKKATKKFSVTGSGAVEKCSFSAGKFFSHEEVTVDNLSELAAALDGLLNEPKKFVIRGMAKENAGDVVRRKNHEPDATFDAVARRYVMLDIDKQAIPAYFDVVENPVQVVEWVREMLPTPFRAASCYYKFSASQNVPKQIGGAPDSVVSVHLWFWCDRPVSDVEWKRYFSANPAPVDLALFSPVQIHYTARPLFEGMDDPLPSRSGVIHGDSDMVFVPEIPEAPASQYTKISREEPEVSAENREKALSLLLPYYKEGKRDRLCGAIAGALYRGGWVEENAADFVYDLAELAGDAEANARYNGALRICDAIDSDRPAQGLATLRKEFAIEKLNDILTLLGIGKPDIDSCISKLRGVHDPAEICRVLKMLLQLSHGEQKAYLEQIQSATKLQKTTLNALLKEAKEEAVSLSPMDWPDWMMEFFLEECFDRGRTLVRASDGRYWKYNGQYWEPVLTEYIKMEMLPFARMAVSASEGRKESASLITAALNLLEGRAYREGDPLHHTGRSAPSVINCQNGELWIDGAGYVELRPHRAESYLKHCLNVSYDPTAAAPRFEQAVLEIFAHSSDPQDMFRHLMELFGYICQPWRKLAIIVLLYGGGSNGKTSLTQLLIKILGTKMVVSDRISDFETSVFKIGSLDGKMLLLDEELEEGVCLPDGFLKKISEEKTMTGQHKYKSPFEFTCLAVPVMSSNSYPAIKDLTKGIRRRVKVIPFKREFLPCEIKTGLFDKIWEEEASGILNLAVQGFQRLKQRGDFLDPVDCENAKQEWLVRSNVLPTFIEERCDTGEENGKTVKQYLREFYAAFKEYCNDTGVRHIPSRSGVEKRLMSMDYKISVKPNGDKVVLALRSRPTCERGGNATAIDLRDEES